MDDHRFDVVARTFALSNTRRHALRVLAAGALTALLPRAARAAPLRQPDGCAPGLTFCDEQPGWAPAGCYDLSADYLHCGSCMHQCPSAGPVDMACANWSCVVIGCGDLTDCTGNLDCADLYGDPNNCGACGNVCESGICDGGQCAETPITCPPGLTYCVEQPTWAPAGCYDLASDYLHCGDCMHQCPSAGPVKMACIGGECAVTDCLDLTDCTGRLDCADLNADPGNCGACGNVCASGQCASGACVEVAIG